MCVKICDGGANNGHLCSGPGDCTGGTCGFAIVDNHCTGAFPAYDDKEKKTGCGLGFELALLVPILGRLRRRRARA